MNATTYAEITREVGELINRHAGNDRPAAARLVFRSAMLWLSANVGAEATAAKALEIGAELLERRT